MNQRSQVCADCEMAVICSVPLGRRPDVCTNTGKETLGMSAVESIYYLKSLLLYLITALSLFFCYNPLANIKTILISKFQFLL